MFSIQFYVFGTHILKFKWEPLLAPPTVTVSNDVHDIDSDFGEGAKKKSI